MVLAFLNKAKESKGVKVQGFALYNGDHATIIDVVSIANQVDVLIAVGNEVIWVKMYDLVQITWLAA